MKDFDIKYKDYDILTTIAKKILNEDIVSWVKHDDSNISCRICGKIFEILEDKSIGTQINEDMIFHLKKLKAFI